MCVGDSDEIVPVDVARELAANALLGSLEVFEGAGHLLSVEQPERFNAVLVRVPGAMDDVTLDELRGRLGAGRPRRSSTCGRRSSTTARRPRHATRGKATSPAR